VEGRVKLVFLLLLAALVGAQDSSSAFEVASIKPADPEFNGTSFNWLNGGGLRVRGATLRALITYAYGIRDFQLFGGPAWVSTARFDVVAKPERSSEDVLADYDKMNDAQSRAAGELIRRRLQVLLGDRFQLAVRRETREMPLYALVVAKAGVKMAESKVGDGTGMSSSNNFIRCKGCTMETVAVELSAITGRPVHDETGLIAKYDFKLEWSPEPKPRGADGPDATPAEFASSEAPTLFTGLQQTLGLKLEARKGPVDLYIIDRAEKPSEN